jgi:hypothetical protein
LDKKDRKLCALCVSVVNIMFWRIRREGHECAGENVTERVVSGGSEDM